MARVDDIITRIKRLANDDSGNFMSDAQLLDAINSCQENIARHDYFKKVTTFDSTADTGEYALATEIPDLARVIRVNWYTSPSYLCQLHNYSEYRNLVETYGSDSASSGTPEYWFVHGTTLLVYPYPDATTSDAFEAFHSYLPPALAAGGTPNTPAAFDQLYVYYGAYEYDWRDHGSFANASIETAEYARAHNEKLLGQLLRAGRTGNAQMIPYR